MQKNTIKRMIDRSKHIKPKWITKGYTIIQKKPIILYDKDVPIDLDRKYIDVLQFNINFNE